MRCLVLVEQPYSFYYPRKVAGLALAWGREALSAIWSEQCRQATQADIETRNLDTNRVTLRSGPDYVWRVMSTLGPVRVMSFAYRDRSMGVGSVTRTPARSVFPLHRKCRSSELCLQWECRLGSEQPFRSSQAALTFFTHGAVSLEDTTISRHLVAVGATIDARWLYRRPAEIRDLLAQRATRDSKTGRPLLYVSSDAHVVRRYVDDGWQPAWKNANGIRLWCIDNETGAIIHLGGEYTFGDCNAVGDAIAWLNVIGVLPSNGDYGGGLVAQLVVVTDGAQWLVEHVHDRLPGAIAVLDVWHVVGYLAEHAATLYVKGSEAARRLLKQMKTALLGLRPRRSRVSETRRGHKKRRVRRRKTNRHKASSTDATPCGVSQLLALLRAHRPPVAHAEAHLEFIAKIGRNAWRMDYMALRQRGVNVGSGAMESLHRNGSQLRLKRPGAKWCADTAQAVLNLRMLKLSGRWDDFWSRPDLPERPNREFEQPTKCIAA